MVRLREVDNPHWRGETTIHFYEGHVVEKDGIVETDNPVWIEALKGRGFRVVEEEEAEPVEVQALAPKETPARRTPPRRTQ